MPDGAPTTSADRPAALDPRELEILDRIQKRVLWLSTYAIHHANLVRKRPDGSKVGGHQASSASVVGLLTALYFKLLRPGDRLAVKPHAAPAFHAIQVLRGKLPAAKLRDLRLLGGLQSYPSWVKDPDEVDISTGSMGLGIVAASYGALMQRYLQDHFGDAPAGRYIAMAGDAELDEGNVWEAVGDEHLTRLGRLLWIVDFNRQSLDRVVPDARLAQVREMFRANGWHVIDLRYGRKLEAAFRLPGGDALRRCLDTMPNNEYHLLLQLPGDRLRTHLQETWGRRDPDLAEFLERGTAEQLRAVIGDLGGHDLAKIIGAVGEAEGVTDRPTAILAFTIKGWGLPFAGDPLNHQMLLTQAQIDALRGSLGIPAGEEWSGFPPGSEEDRYIRATLEPFEAAGRPSPAPAPVAQDIPETLGLTYPPASSTQEALGSLLLALSREARVAPYIVTASADVAISTNLGSWINRMGVYFPVEREDVYAAGEVPRPLKWRPGPKGQHIELGIAENALFLLLSIFGLSTELTGRTLLPIGTVYDPFVCRGLDALFYGGLAHSKFILIATPSGISLSYEGGAHQSVITPSIGIEIPQFSFFEPAFAVELEWMLLAALRNLLNRHGGQSVYLRLSTKEVDQGLLAPALAQDPDGRALRDAVLRGGYRLRDRSGERDYRPGENVVHIFAMGIMVPEAVAASDLLLTEGIHANVINATSPDLLYRGFSRAGRIRMKGSAATALSHLDRLVPPAERAAPVVTVLDGHSHTLAFLGTALGTRSICLGVDDYGQSGTRPELYDFYEIGTAAIAQAARAALE